MPSCKGSCPRTTRRRGSASASSPRSKRCSRSLARTCRSASLNRLRFARESALGDVRVAQGDLAGALQAYEAGRAIAEKLAGSDPGNAGWQRDLSVSWERVGVTRKRQGDTAGALEAWRRALAVSLPLAKAHPDSVDIVTTAYVH